MKKVIVAIFAIFYLAISSGFTLHMHYCMNKLAEWGLAQNNSSTCPKCGMKKTDNKHKGCCKDEHKFVKNDSDQKIAEAGLQMVKAVALPVSLFEIFPIDFPSVTEKNPLSHAPPRRNGVAVYIRNCVFLI
jgi:hypothetical protein